MQERQNAAFTKAMQQEVEHFYLTNYIRHFRAEGVKVVLASIPQVSSWAGVHNTLLRAHLFLCRVNGSMPHSRATDAQNALLHVCAWLTDKLACC